MSSIMINLEELLHQAYTLGLETDDKSCVFSKAQLRTILFRSVPLFGKVEESSITDATAKPKSKNDNKPKDDDKEKKPRKPRVAPADETRCHARTFNEKEHLENGKPKVMNPDDENNLYGGRCTSKKNADSDFCKMHAEKHTHGVWDGAYGDKCNSYLKSKETTVDKPKKTIKRAPKLELDTDENDEDEYMSSANKLEDAKIEYDWIDIDGEDFMIDQDGNVYSPENEEVIGVYDTTTKAWISGGPDNDDEDDE